MQGACGLSGIVSSFPAEAFLGNVGPGDGALIADVEEQCSISRYCSAVQVFGGYHGAPAKGCCGGDLQVSRGAPQGALRTSVLCPSIPSPQLSLCH